LFFSGYTQSDSIRMSCW